jgi:hypothetical protein
VRTTLTVAALIGVGSATIAAAVTIIVCLADRNVALKAKVRDRGKTIGEQAHHLQDAMEENDRLQIENGRLVDENRELQALVDTYIDGAVGEEAS